MLFVKLQPETTGAAWFKFSISTAPPKRASLFSNTESVIETVPLVAHEATAPIPPVLM